MPLSLNSKESLDGLGELEPWTALEELWAEGSVTAVNPGEWLLAYDALDECEPEVLELFKSLVPSKPPFVYTSGTG